MNTHHLYQETQSSPVARQHAFEAQVIAASIVASVAFRFPNADDLSKQEHLENGIQIAAETMPGHESDRERLRMAVRTAIDEMVP